MDALLSIPALSLLFITTFSSYSTTLNLLFFYLTWATLIISHTPLVVEILGTLVIRVLFYILPSLGFLLFDSALPNAAVVIKEHGDCALPLSGDDIGRKSRCWKIVLVSLGNLILGVTLQAAVESLFTKVFRIRSALKTTISLPMPWDVAKDLFCGVLIREVGIDDFSGLNT